MKDNEFSFVHLWLRSFQYSKKETSSRQVDRWLWKSEEYVAGGNLRVMCIEMAFGAVDMNEIKYPRTSLEELVATLLHGTWRRMTCREHEEER